ncbi:MAG: hypothetical protein MUC94_13030, partial [bacterium]|nr:hypothetical protein [bacterium]
DGADKMSGMRQVAANETWGGSFNAEVQAMIIEGYWHPGETQAQKPEIAQFNRSTWVPVPEERRGEKVQGTGGHYVVFFKEAKNAEAGFKFAEFLTSDELNDKIFKELGWLPAYQPYLDKADPKAFPGLERMRSSLLIKKEEYLKSSRARGAKRTANAMRHALCAMLKFLHTIILINPEHFILTKI